MNLEVILDRRSEVRPLVDEVVVASPVRVALQEQGRLVDAVDHAVGGDVLRRAREPREGGEQIHLVDHVARDLPGLDDAGPQRGGGDAKAGRIKRKFQIAGHDTKRGTDGAPLQVLFCLP